METIFKIGAAINKRYIIKLLIGKGGIGTTYLAEDKIYNRDVVLKVLPFAETGEWKVLELFEREIAVLKTIDWPHIPDYYDNFDIKVDNKLYYVLVQEYVKGKNLYQMIKSGHKFSLKQSLDILNSLLKTLNYIHNLKPALIHRDINPKNIILDNNGEVYLVDFGSVGQICRDTLAAAMSDTFVGTVGYMPPEQLYGKVFVTSDLYSLGVTFLFLLTGKEPYEFKLKNLKINYKPNTHIPLNIEKILDKIIDPDEGKRIKSANRILKLLKHPLQDQLEKQKLFKKSSEDDIFISPPPRRIPFFIKYQIKKNRTRSISEIGLMFGFMGLLFFHIFVGSARVISSFALINADTKATGQVISIESTNSTENEMPVYKINFIFTAEDGNQYKQHSFTTRPSFDINQKVIIHYVADNPRLSVIQGERFSTFGPFVLFIVIFPIIGYVMLFISRPRRFSRYLKILKKGYLTKGVITEHLSVNFAIMYFYTYLDNKGYETDGEFYTKDYSFCKKGKTVRVLFLEGERERSILIDNSIPYKDGKWDNKNNIKATLISLARNAAWVLLVLEILFVVNSFYAG